VPVTVGGGEAGSISLGSGSVPERETGSVPERPTGRFSGDGYDETFDDDSTDEEEVRRLRRSVGVEVVIAVVILAITALLVNAAPARSATIQPIALTLKSSQVWVYTDVVPGTVGPNDMHFTALPTGGGPASVQDMQVQLTRPGQDLPPFTVPLQKLGSGHYYAPLYDIPYSGKWQMTVRVQLSATDEAVLVGTFDVR
jgi:copper transport protein